MLPVLFASLFIVEKCWDKKEGIRLSSNSSEMSYCRKRTQTAYRKASENVISDARIDSTTDVQNIALPDGVGEEIAPNAFEDARQPLATRGLRDILMSPSGGRRYQCEICESVSERVPRSHAVFQNQKEFQNHVMQFHRGVPIGESKGSSVLGYCARCDIQFRSLKNYQIHKSYYCNTRLVFVLPPSSFPAALQEKTGHLGQIQQISSKTHLPRDLPVLEDLDHDVLPGHQSRYSAVLANYPAVRSLHRPATPFAIPTENICISSTTSSAPSHPLAALLRRETPSVSDHVMDVSYPSQYPVLASNPTIRDEQYRVVASPPRTIIESSAPQVTCSKSPAVAVTATPKENASQKTLSDKPEAKRGAQIIFLSNRSKRNG